MRQRYPKSDRIGHFIYRPSMAWVGERHRPSLGHHQYLPKSQLVQNQVSKRETKIEQQYMLAN